MINVCWPYNYYIAFKVGQEQLNIDHDRKIYKVD